MNIYLLIDVIIPFLRNISVKEVKNYQCTKTLKLRLAKCGTWSLVIGVLGLINKGVAKAEKDEKLSKYKDLEIEMQ